MNFNQFEQKNLNFHKHNSINFIWGLCEIEIPTLDLINETHRPNCGALNVFLGTPRDNAGENKVEYLDYEAYSEMALEEMRILGEEAFSLGGIEGLVILHRLGKVKPMESSILVSVSSARRKISFERCQWVVDTFKERVPIWKKEVFSDGGGAWIANDSKQPLEDFVR